MTDTKKLESLELEKESNGWMRIVTKNCEIVEIAHEIGRDDDEIERKDPLAEDPNNMSMV